MATDPLGALASVVDLKDLSTWNVGEIPVYDIMVDDPHNMRKSPFEWNDDINHKIVLW